MQIVQDIVEILVSGINSLSAGIGSGLQEFVKSAFVTTNESGAVTGLSIFGSVLVAFAGVSLAIGLTKLVYHFITSFGKNGN